MQNKLQLKVCGMRDKENLEALIRLQPDYVGFIFYPKSKRYVGKDFPTEITRVVPGDIKKAGVFVNEQTGSITDLIQKHGLSLIQLHGDETPEFCSRFSEEQVQVVKAFRVDEQFDFDVLKSYETCVDYYLFDTFTQNYGGSGKKFNWEILADRQIHKPFFLSGGIGPEDARTVQQLKHPDLYAIDINSKFETEPAFKDIKLIKNFMSRLYDLPKEQR